MNSQTPLSDIAILDPDGLTELRDRDFPFEVQGGRVIDVERERERVERQRINQKMYEWFGGLN